MENRDTHRVPATGHHRGLVVAHEHATLTYIDGMYKLAIQRELHNHGDQPITRYLVQIAVDRFPEDPDRSRKFYSANPLTLRELEFHAWHGTQGTKMLWEIQHDLDAFKEIWLRFENGHEHFPLYPGEKTHIEYRFHVSEAKWGQWFRRAIRLPTDRLSIDVDLPADKHPTAWGLHMSLASHEVPFTIPISTQGEYDRIRYSWSTEDPPLGAYYRIMWQFHK